MKGNIQHCPKYSLRTSSFQITLTLHFEDPLYYKSNNHCIGNRNYINKILHECNSNNFVFLYIPGWFPTLQRIVNFMSTEPWCSLLKCTSVSECTCAKVWLFCVLGVEDALR